MVVGFNHNFAYGGVVYHVQTEDHGPRSPSIVTLLYRDGTILVSRKVSYADIVRVDNLEQVVTELMKEQHREVLRSLKNGGFDDVIARFEGRPANAGTPQPAATPAAASPPPAVAPLSARSMTERLATAGATGLERMVLAYLTGEDS
jgi:hypothetical protein